MSEEKIMSFNPPQKNSTGSLQKVTDWFSRSDNKIAITGLSRSGKSMLFTSLIYLLSERTKGAIDHLPLLRSLPKKLIDHITLSNIDETSLFDYEKGLEALSRGEWPNSTQAVSGFKLQVYLKEDRFLLGRIKKFKIISFEFYDYPGEWLTDLPMLNKSFESWSQQAFSQETMEPLKSFSAEWHEFISDFDFDAPVSQENLAKIMTVYKHYLISSKNAGITILQPASMLLETTDFDWIENGFTPLPDYVLTDKLHPWTQFFTENYQKYQKNWLKPLQEKYFENTDMQIILVDLLEGLHFGQNHLKQLKTTISHIADNFTYGNRFYHKIFNKFDARIKKVAFVATKSDLIPYAQHQNFRSLLKNITEGVSGKIDREAVSFEYFILTAINTTAQKPDEENIIYYQNLQGDTIRRKFDAIPGRILAIKNNQTFPFIKTYPSKDYEKQILQSQGIDSLLNYMLGG